MQFGAFVYNFVYNPNSKKVCINSSETIPATVNCYTKRELRDLAKQYEGINPLYKEALKYFPEENKR